MGFKDYILQLDLIGKAPTLYINNQLSVKTFVGSAFSLFVIVVSLAYLVYLFLKMNNKENPIVSSLDLKMAHPTPLLLNSSNFEIIFSIQDPFKKTMFINETVYKQQLNLLTNIVGKKEERFLISTTLNLTVCNNRKIFSKEIYENIKELKLDNYYCISEYQPIPWNQIYLNDYWGNIDFKMLQG